MQPEPPADFAIRDASIADGEALATIYNPYVKESIVTFEEHTVSGAQMAERLTEVQRASLPWLVLEQGREVLGYAYANIWKARSAYRFATEVAVYVEQHNARRGIGARLYAELLSALRSRTIHVAVGVIALPNEASVALHQKCGFQQVALLPEIGFKFGRWLDVGYWQKLL